MYTKEDFQKIISESIDRYPTLSTYYQARDPRILQQQDAVATMFAMLSAQIETAQLETFQKSRDATVLADATMRGIVRKASCARGRIRMYNSHETLSYTLEAGRILLDTDGREWIVTQGATVGPLGEAIIDAEQRTEETMTHTVTDYIPFYAIKIPESTDGSYLAAIKVEDDDGEYEYRQSYVNIGAGERIYHVEADERQNTYVRFGFGGVVGTQPENGSQITLTIYRCSGNFSLDYESPLNLKYTTSVLEGSIEFTFYEMVQEGSDPLSISYLRELAKYPSIYNENSVFLGEFDFLIRRNYPNLQFLSVWNESMEEHARGPSLDNINCLFVACLDEDEKVIEHNGVESIPEVVDEADWSGTQQAIYETIMKADDSYKVRFYTPVRYRVKVDIQARISSAYVVSDVKAAIKDTILNEYGIDSAFAKKGAARVLYRNIYSLLKANVSALSDGDADLEVQITDVDLIKSRPEVWRYIDDTSLTIEVETANITRPGWGM